jgi:hypothetical protein
MYDFLSPRRFNRLSGPCLQAAAEDLCALAHSLVRSCSPLRALTAEGSDIQSALKQITGATTVPRVFVNSEHIGGNDDTQVRARIPSHSVYTAARSPGSSSSCCASSEPAQEGRSRAQAHRRRRGREAVNLTSRHLSTSINPQPSRRDPSSQLVRLSHLLHLFSSSPLWLTRRASAL